MVKRFLKAYKSESRRILLAQHGDLDFSELEKLTSNDLARLATEEDAIKMSVSKQRRDSQVTRKKAGVVEKSISE